MGNYQPFLQGPLPVANYTRIIIPGRFWTRPPSTKSTRMASSATPLHDSLIELAIPDAHAHAIKWYLKEVGQLDYTVDMELCTCSCSVGQTGAACKHQAAIAKKYNIASLSIVPIHCKKTRQLYAYIARGESYIMEKEFYADLCDITSDAAGVDQNLVISNVDDNDILYHKQSLSPEKLLDDNIISEFKGEDSWQMHCSQLQHSLSAITTDLMGRLTEGDHTTVDSG